MLMVPVLQNLGEID